MGRQLFGQPLVLPPSLPPSLDRDPYDNVQTDVGVVAWDFANLLIDHIDPKLLLSSTGAGIRVNVGLWVLPQLISQ